jgi:hypothetical protein
VSGGDMTKAATESTDTRAQIREHRYESTDKRAPLSRARVFAERNGDRRRERNRGVDYALTRPRARHAYALLDSYVYGFALQEASLPLVDRTALPISPNR